MKKIILSLLFVCFAAQNLVYAAQWNFPLGGSGRYDCDLELNPYYSSIGVVMSLTDDPVPRLEISSEAGIYLQMLETIYRPRFFLVEASINPLPIAGVLVKKEKPGLYEDAQVNPNLNLVKAITDGFPDPGALSFFFGNIADFTRGDTGESAGRGYSGLLLSLGNYHIVNNTLVQDYWQEVEVKLKGASERNERKLEWSYAVGGKFHRNPEVKNTAYFAVKRTRVDYMDRDKFSCLDFFIKNSSQQLRIDFSEFGTPDRGVSRIFFMMGKNFSFSRSFIFGLNAGFLKVFRSGYSGTLADKVDGRWSFLMRPAISFNF